MTAQAQDPVAGDRLFADLLRRRPDVDLVLLPAPIPQPRSAAPTSYDDARRLERRCALALATATAAIGREPNDRHGRWISASGGHRYVEQASVRGLLVDDVATCLGAAALLLGELGWSFSPVDGARLRLEATAGPIRLTADGSDTSIELEVSSSAVTLAESVLADLRGR